MDVRQSCLRTPELSLPQPKIELGAACWLGAGSFESVGRWLKELQDHCADKSVAKILVGNKTDLR
jgi:GTPase SAR1 family protein